MGDVICPQQEPAKVLPSGKISYL